MISKILEEVKSPFTDELIHDLIEKYITCGCDDNLFYNEINQLDNTDKSSYSPHTEALISQIYSQGISKSELWNYPDKDNVQLVYDRNSSWVILYSEDDPMKDKQRTPNNRNPLVYRIYLNLKDKEKTEFIQNYIKRFHESKIPFELKFSQDDTRLDQIVILSRAENLEENVLTVEELTKDIKLGDLPALIGEYKNKIGIAEEYYNRLYSPTKAKLSLVRSSVKKYLCDHVDEFESQLSDEEKKKINEYIGEFNYLYESEKGDIEECGNKYEDLGKSYYQEKSTIDCAKEHIENDRDAYVCGTGLLDLGNAIKQIYSNNPEQFISEISQNYRMIGTQVWGFSQDFVFSNETERTLLKSKENEVFLSSEQIGSELGEISRKRLTDSVQADLIRMVEEKEKSKEIEQ